MKVLVVLLLLSVSAVAEKKVEPTYQDAVLKSYRSVASGMRCSGGVHMNDENGTTDSQCSNTTHVEYALLVGEQTFLLASKLSGKKVGLAMATMGYSRFFEKDNVLYGQLPNTAVRIRSEGGTFHIKLGKRESLYRLVGAE